MIIKDKNIIDSMKNLNMISYSFFINGVFIPFLELYDY